VVVSFAQGTAKIHAVNLITIPATVQTLATTPNGSGSLDGIARDKQGRYYVSSWDANTITRYDSNFTSPTVFASGLETPADIFFNAATDTLVVPNFNRNTLDFIRIPPPMATSVRTSSDASVFSLALAPNPAQEHSTLSYRLPKAATVSISLVNVLGQTLSTWEIGKQAAGEYQQSLSFSRIPTGVYYCRVQADDDMAMVRVNLIR
jgi:Secretion system C-terminal sorting domain